MRRRRLASTAGVGPDCLGIRLIDRNRPVGEGALVSTQLVENTVLWEVGMGGQQGDSPDHVD